MAIQVFRKATTLYHVFKYKNLLTSAICNSGARNLQINSKMVKAKKYILAKQFDGEPKENDIKLEEEELPPLEDNEILCEGVFWSVDPYMRAYMPKFPVGTPMFGEQVAKIIESRHRDFPVGKYVVGNFGWQTHTIADVTDPSLSSFYPFQILPDFGNLPVSLALGTLGMTGNTAYFGFKEICQPKLGEIVVVSGAAGAVGSHVGQIAHILGCKVIGFAGSDEKVKWLTDVLKFDKAYNYKTTRIGDALREAAPDGVDCYFDNVGGTLSSTVINHMRDYGRIAVCGAISAYNSKKGELNTAPIVQPPIVMKQLKMEGIVVTRWKDRWQEGIKQNLKWIQEGKLKWRETVTVGFENMPKALFGMLKGENIGKAIVKAKL